MPLANFDDESEDELPYIHQLLQYPHSLLQLLQSTDENKRLSLLRITDQFGRTLLHAFEFYPNPNLFRDVLLLIPEEKRLEEIKYCDSRGRTVLHCICMNVHLLSILLSCYPVNKRYAALTHTDNFNNSTLDLVASKPEILNCILSFLPRHDCQRLLESTLNSGHSILRDMASDPFQLQLFIKNLYKDELQLLFTQTDSFKRLFLHYAVANAASLKISLASYPKNKMMTDIFKVDCFGRTLLHQTRNVQAFLNTLHLYPRKARKKILRTKDLYKVTALDMARQIPEFRELLDKGYSNKQFFKMFYKKDISTDPLILHHFFQSPRLLHNILEFKSAEARQLAIHQIERFSNSTILHICFQNPLSLKAILKFVPIHQRLSHLERHNGFGQTVVYLATQNYLSIKTILELLPKSQRLKAITTKNASNTTPLKSAVQYHYAALHAMLSTLTKKQRSQALNIIDSYEPNTNQSPAQKMGSSFVIQLEIMKQKTEELIKKAKVNSNYETAALKAKKLTDSLTKYFNQFLINKNPQEFKIKCMRSINKTKETLETHRGWKQIVGNIILAISGLIIFYACATLYNKKTTGRFLFFQTDSANKLNQLQEKLDDFVNAPHHL